MAKDITLNEIGDTLAFIVERMATKDDIAELRRDLKGEIFSLQQQVTSIETQLRDMRHTKLHARAADLEEEVFGKPRD
jgi:hypothetical protein